MAAFYSSLINADSTACNNRKSDAIKKAVTSASEVADATIAQPQLDAIEKCLDGLKGTQGNISFGLSLPSFDDLIQGVCNFAVQQVNSQISNIDYQFDPLSGLGNGFGSGIPTRNISLSTNASGNNGITTKTNSGFSGLNQSVSNVNPFSQPILPQQQNNTDNSLSNPFSSAINNAIQYLTGNN